MRYSFFKSQIHQQKIEMGIGMKFKRIIAALFTGILISVSVFAPKADAAKNNNSGPKPSSLSSDSAIVMEVSTGTILYKKNIHKQHYPASITKIMTSLLALENSSLSETVTFSKDAVYGIESGSSTIYSDVGEKMSLEQCLYAIMLESANEVCLAVGEHVAGSSDKFVDMMNDKVKSLGLKDTHFNNPNGLPDPKHYTTAYDMAVIAREAIQNSTFKKVCGTRTYTCAKTNTHKTTRVWRNHHQMINGYDWPQYEYKYALGGKTGYTNIAHSTLVTFGEKNGMQLVCVIMYANSPKQGTPNEYSDTTALLNYGFEHYKKHTLNDKATELNSNLFNNYDSFFNPEKSPIHLASEAAVILPKGVSMSKVKQKITYNDKAVIKDGENVIGQVTYTYGKKTVGSTDIIYDTTTSDHLDEASRKIVNAEIQDIEDSNANTGRVHKLFTTVKNAIIYAVGVVTDFVQAHIIMALIIVATVLLIAIIVRNISNSFDNRITRNSGGYRSRGGRRNHARMQRQLRRNNSSGKRTRRNHSKHYQSSTPVKKSNSSGKRKNINYSKRRKNTRESFGKNFFDF